MTQMLIGHRDIQNWVNACSGRPAIQRVHDKMGRIEARLALNFASRRTLDETPGVDDGLSPVSWTAWLAELDRRHLALVILDKSKPAFEFVERGDIH